MQRMDIVLLLSLMLTVTSCRDETLSSPEQEPKTSLAKGTPIAYEVPKGDTIWQHSGFHSSGQEEVALADEKNIFVAFLSGGPRMVGNSIMLTTIDTKSLMLTDAEGEKATFCGITTQADEILDEDYHFYDVKSFSPLSKTLFIIRYKFSPQYAPPLKLTMNGHAPKTAALLTPDQWRAAVHAVGKDLDQ